jgi:hypothetical protein
MSYPTLRKYEGNYDFNKAEGELCSNAFKPLGYNLYLVRIDEDTIGIQLYQTIIIEFHRDGRIQLYAYKYTTPTTRMAIKKSLVGFSVGSSNNKWVVYDTDNFIEYYFEDGITINADGQVEGRAVYLDKAESAAGRSFKDISDLIDYIKTAEDKALNKLFNRRNESIRELIAQHAPLEYIPLIITRAKPNEEWGRYARERISNEEWSGYARERIA